jgi:hypothetical protein
MKASKVLAACVVISVAGAQVVAAQSPQAPKPGPEHARLGYFVGKWKTEGEMKPSPMGPGGKMTGTDTCNWFEGRFTVVCRSEGTGPWGPTKSIGILGYSTEEKVYTYYGVDNSPMTMATVPKGVPRSSSSCTRIGPKRRPASAHPFLTSA